MYIEKNIEAPTPKGGRNPVYPFREMEVGDSVFLEGQDMNKENKGYMSAWAYGRRSGKKFTGRVVEGGLRIWRVE